MCLVLAKDTPQATICTFILNIHLQMNVKGKGQAAVEVPLGREAGPGEGGAAL